MTKATTISTQVPQPSLAPRKWSESPYAPAKPGAMEQRLYELAFNNSPIGTSFVLLDADAADRHVVHCNPALCAFLGRSAEELRSIDIADITHPDDVGPHREIHRQLLDGERDGYELEKRYLHKDGRVLWAHLQVQVIRYADGGPSVLLTQVVDIDERKAHLERMCWRAEHDPLTGTVNRTELFARLRRAVERASPEAPVLVMYLDLDGFKQVNDRHGHAAGDLVLQQVAAHMAGMLRPGDTIARLGGDEFVLVVEGVHDAPAAGALATRLLEALRSEVRVEGVGVDLSASIGIVLAGGGEPEALLQRADTALYAAKRAGRDRYVIAS